jgi:hypothetical protein
MARLGRRLASRSGRHEQLATTRRSMGMVNPLTVLETPVY